MEGLAEATEAADPMEGLVAAVPIRGEEEATAATGVGAGATREARRRSVAIPTTLDEATRTAEATMADAPSPEEIITREADRIGVPRAMVRAGADITTAAGPTTEAVGDTDTATAADSLPATTGIRATTATMIRTTAIPM